MPSNLKPIRFLTTSAQRAAIEAAAEAAGQSLSDFVRDAAEMRAREYGVTYPRDLGAHGDFSRVWDAVDNRRVAIVQPDGTYAFADRAPTRYASRLSHPMYPVAVYFLAHLEAHEMQDIANDIGIVALLDDGDA